MAEKKSGTKGNGTHWRKAGAALLIAAGIWTFGAAEEVYAAPDETMAQKVEAAVAFQETAAAQAEQTRQEAWEAFAQAEAALQTLTVQVQEAREAAAQAAAGTDAGAALEWQISLEQQLAGQQQVWAEAAQRAEQAEAASEQASALLTALQTQEAAMQQAQQEAAMQQAVQAQQAMQAQQEAGMLQNTSNIILVGDSRTGEMHGAVGDAGCIWIAGYGGGIQWFREYARKEVEKQIVPGSRIIINLGVNDPGKVNEYITEINACNMRWREKGAVVYYAMVGPVGENPWHSAYSIDYFNQRMRDKLDASIVRIPEDMFLAGSGFVTGDGLHYDAATSVRVFDYWMSCL